MALEKAAKPQPIRKDPAGFRSTERENARLLIGLIDDFEELVVRALVRQVGGRMMSERELAPRVAGKSLIPNVAWTASLIVPLPESLMTVMDAVDQIETAIDKDPAMRVAARINYAATAHGVQWASKSLRKVGIEIADTPRLFYLPPEQRLIELSNKQTYSEIKGLTNDVSKRLSRTLTEGYRNSETINQLVKRVKAATSFSRNKAITIARTETLRVGNAAAVERYKSYGIEMVEYIAALDDRVCEDCESLHEKKFVLGEEPDLPIHPNCRCTYVAYIESDDS